MMNKWITVAIIMLITAAAFLTVNAFYSILEANLVTPPAARAAVADKGRSTLRPRKPVNRYNLIVERNLFGSKTSPAAKPEVVDVDALKQTQLNLKLWGTVAGPGGVAYAVIEESGNRRQNLYKVGDTLENATVRMILREKVILAVNGKDEVLQIEELKSSPGRSPRVAAAAAPPPPSIDSDQRVTVEKDKLEDALQNVNQLMKQIRIRPHFTNGKPDGISLSGVRRGSIFSDIGFRSGDIITGVNGEPIESVDDALKFYSSLKNATSVSLDLRRNGVQRTIEYTVE